jgi:hypothetical protein
MATLTHEVDKGPVIFAWLQNVKSQFGDFPTAQSTTQQNGEEGCITLTFEGSGSGRLPETASLLGRQPIAEPDAQLLWPLHPLNASGQFRAQQSGVRSLISEPTNSGKSYVDGSRRQLAIFEMDSVACDDSLVEGETRLRTIPSDELIDGMPIATLRLR